MSEAFEIRYTPSNRGRTIPDHWDIFLKGQDDSIITVWDSEAMALECVKFLDEYPARKRGTQKIS